MHSYICIFVCYFLSSILALGPHVQYLIVLTNQILIELYNTSKRFGFAISSLSIFLYIYICVCVCVCVCVSVCEVHFCDNIYIFGWCCSYVPNPVLVIIDVQPKELGIPTKAYYDVEEVKEVRKISCFFICYLYIEIAYGEWLSAVPIYHFSRD